MSSSKKSSDDTYASKHVSSLSKKEANIIRRKHEYPDEKDAHGTIRVHSPEDRDPRGRVLKQWVECEKQGEDGNCLSATMGYFVRLEDGTLKKAIKVFGATCDASGGQGAGRAEGEASGV